MDVLREAVGILPQHVVEVRPVGVPDLLGLGAADAVAGEKHHGGALLLLVLEDPRDLPGAPLADSFDLCEPLRLLVQDAHRVVPEGLDNPLCKRRADPADRAAPQVALDGLPPLRCPPGEGGKFELPAVDRVLPIGAPHRAGVSRMDLPGVADTGQVLPGLRRKDKHRVLVLLIPICDLLHIPDKCFFQIPSPAQSGRACSHRGQVLPHLVISRYFNPGGTGDVLHVPPGSHRHRGQRVLRRHRADAGLGGDELLQAV